VAGANCFYKNIRTLDSGKREQGLDTIQDEPARYNLLRYGEDRWNAAALTARLGWLPPGPQSITSRLLVTSSDLSQVAPPADRAFGSGICARRWKSTHWVDNVDYAAALRGQQAEWPRDT